MRYGGYVLASLIESKQFSEIKAVCRISKDSLDVVMKTVDQGDDAVSLAEFTVQVLSRTLGLKDPVLRHRTKTNVLAYHFEENPGRTHLHV